MSLVYIALFLALLAVAAVLILRRPQTFPDDAESGDLEAQRFAQLLVAEVKLYNARQVEEGRKHGDLYRRLKKEIDRAREMYDKRAGGREDHFHAELVRVIAGGDANALGADYRQGARAHRQ